MGHMLLHRGGFSHLFFNLRGVPFDPLIGTSTLPSWPMGRRLLHVVLCVWVCVGWVVC